MQKNLERVVLVGLSMGGTLVLDVVSRGADVAGLITINAPVLNREDFGSRIGMSPIVEWILPFAPGFIAGLACNDAAKPGVDEKAYKWLPTGAGNSLLRELPKIRGRLADVRAPALIAYSVQDHSVPPANSKAIVRMIGSEDITELPLERSYHLATMDYDFELLEKKIGEFVDRVGKVAGAPSPEPPLQHDKV
jgi:carboxylesterase